MLTQGIPTSDSSPVRPRTPALSEFVCGPCSFSRIYSRGTFYCPVCKELFCHNCAKLHRMKEWSQNHAIVLLDKANSKQLKAIASQKISKSERESSQRPQRWGRRAPLNEGFESKSKYLNALASNHDHETEDLENELYCPEHDVVFCLRCKDPHSECKGTVPIVSLAKKIEIAQVISNYKRCVKFADIMLEDRLEQKKQVESQRSEIIPNIQSMKNHFGNMISKKATVIENEVSIKIEQNIKKIHQHMEKCKRVKYMAQSDLDSLLSTVERAVPGPIVKVYLRLKVKYSVFEKYLRELYNDTEYVSYQFVPNEEIMTLPNIISSIGTLKETKSSSKLPPFMSVDNVKPFKERSLTYRKNGDIRLFGLGVLGKGGITSMRCTANYIMAVARSTCEFRVFTLRGWTFAHLTLSSLPWDFTMISEKEAIVSLPGDKKLVTLTIDFTLRRVTQTREIILDEACWGLTEFKGKLIGTFLPFELDAHLRVMTYDGTMERKIEIQDSPVAFRAPQYVLYHEDKVYISDSYSHALIIIDLDGHVTFAFKVAEFENPAGMTVDDQGNVYVCGKTSHNVFQISREGEIREILSQEDCPSRPCCIGLLGDGSTLLVGYSNSNVLKSFQFK
ncbi:uncharacterized protein LOC133197795 [Saccostrea echinata]|uniref:uncharacterized protein LOC133197795 n=1 Tax=Saccostrea echinata TaxID=191078 RepID=UPI002A83D4D7|nr:uncharacterized protein LOC133197795 [Saccostrea echinata]